MKANKAPKEIYLLPDDRNPNGLSLCWYEAPYCTGAIKYTRTDVFIKKAYKWLETHICVFKSVEEVDMFKDLFKKAMGGE